MMSTCGMDSPGTGWLPVSEAARRLGYGRSRTYELAAELGARKDPATGRLGFPERQVLAYLADPPVGRRPVPQPARVPAAVGPAEQGAQDTTRELERLIRRVEALEERLEDGGDVEYWRRQAIAARHALVEVALVGDMYEEVLASEEAALDLDRRAADRRGRARTGLRTLLAAHRGALRMAAAPVDLADG